MNSTNTKLNKFIKVSLLAAIAVVLMYIDFPLLPMFPWLKIDLSDVPALMGAFAFGPLTGIVVELVKNFLIVLVKGSSTGFVGEFANFLVGVALVLPASIIYHRNKTKKSAIIGMIVGTLSIEIIGILANVFILLPLYGMNNMVGEELINYVVLGLVPFNGVKALIVCVVTYLLYKRLSTAIFKVEPMLDVNLKKRVS